MRVAFFDLLEPEARVQILTTRANAVMMRLAHLQMLKALAHDAQADRYPRQVLLFHEQQIQAEFDWIQHLLQSIQKANERKD
ncbi:MAG: hypothetical protein ACRDHW_22800 [Ktedonobacteraceae bacterium]